VSVADGSPLTRSITWTEDLRLSHRQNSISFTFSALNYILPRKNLYAYRLEGFDGDWIHVGAASRTARYTNLDPGRYLFRVKGANNDGVWNDEGAAIRVIITPPFWQTWWFRMVVAATVLGLAVWWHRRRMNRLTARLKTEVAMERFCLKRGISEREREIIGLILDGKTNREIEEILFISHGTVKNHVYHIYQKLDVNSRVQLVNLFRNIPSGGVD
jgi:DNA-binding CsgD family transcriptional regulator